MKTKKQKSAVLLIMALTYQIISSSVFSQVPEKMSYQAVIRNNNGELVLEHYVGIRIQIKQGSEFGESVYVETHKNPTNENGLVTLEIGDGNTIAGSISEINWEDGPFFIQTEIDPSGGTNYSISSTSQLVSVPYAFYALKAVEITETDPLFSNSVARGISAEDTVRWNAKFDSYTEVDPSFNGSVAKGITAADTVRWNHKLSAESQNLSNVLIKGNNGGGMQIKNIADPTEKQDVATKAYIDAIQLQITLLEQKLFDIEFNDGNDSISDIDGNFYKIVKIGNQYWMAENLRTTKFNDSTLMTGSSGMGKDYCWYNNDINYKYPYGALYNQWMQNKDKICPVGWHVSSISDWDELIAIAGGDSVAGGKLKEMGLQHWITPNADATDFYGFMALPGGVIHETAHGSNSGFKNIGTYGIYWALGGTDSSTLKMKYYTFSNENGIISAFISGRWYFSSVRCVKD